MGTEGFWLLLIGFSLIASEPISNSTEEVFASKYLTIKMMEMLLLKCAFLFNLHFTYVLHLFIRNIYGKTNK